MDLSSGLPKIPVCKISLSYDDRYYIDFMVRTDSRITDNVTHPHTTARVSVETLSTRGKPSGTKNSLFSTPNFNLKRDGQILRPEVCLCGSRTATRTETALFVWPFPSSCSAGTPIFFLQRIFSVARAIRVFTVHKAVYLAAAVCTLTRKETFSFSSYHAMHRGRYISKPGWSISG